MIIGYSVDTDIVLTTNMLRGGGVRSAMKTGLTMSAAAIAAFFAMYAISGSIVLQEMALVIILGILVDIPATYLANAGILRMWMERKHAGA
jgi:preprotein translocase subunit SecF